MYDSRNPFRDVNQKPSTWTTSGTGTFASSDSHSKFSRFRHSDYNNSGHSRKKAAPSQRAIETDPVTGGCGDGTNSSWPREDFGAFYDAPYHGVETKEDFRDKVLDEFKDVFRATARHCFLDPEFDSNSFPFERFFLGNLAHGRVVSLEEELYSDSDESFPSTTQIQCEKSLYENRFDVLFDRLTLSYDLWGDTVSLHWTSMVDMLPQYLRHMVSSYLMDLPLEQSL
ncbi:hypothetical protein MMC26_003664 [Xylographa opegraphella]|nr:hypothetical protein [Xylographa opegraphella]